MSIAAAWLKQWLEESQLKSIGLCWQSAQVVASHSMVAEAVQLNHRLVHQAQTLELISCTHRGLPD